MSPSYLSSVWCDTERRAFLDVAKDRAADGSLIVVRARPVVRAEQPEEFRDLEGLKFFTAVENASDHRVLGYPDPNNGEFIDRIGALNGVIVEQLRKCRQKTGESASSIRVARQVFVAATTDDLDDREMELRNYIRQAGIDVLPSPQSRYPTTDIATFENAILEELDHCCLFVQLLSPVCGKELSLAPGKRLPALQYHLAQRAKKPILQWRERDCPTDSKDPDHHAMLENACACGMEEFKRMVTERSLLPEPEIRPDPPPQVAIFVNADARDRRLALDVSQALADLDVDCYRMPETGSPAEIRVALEKNLRECDGIVLIYGNTEFYWVQEQIRQARKLSGTGSQLSTMAIFEGPPSDKPEIPVTIKNLVMLDCRAGLDPSKLRQFVSNLRH